LTIRDEPILRMQTGLDKTPYMNRALAVDKKIDNIIIIYYLIDYI
jgi:hypothetical protein